MPPSSLAPVSVTVAGVVAVSNFPADQLVHFSTPVDVTVDNFPAMASEATLDRVADSLDDVALTAILQREALPA